MVENYCGQADAAFSHVCSQPSRKDVIADGILQSFVLLNAHT